MAINALIEGGAEVQRETRPLELVPDGDAVRAEGSAGRSRL